jgi:hypothetical protein
VKKDNQSIVASGYYIEQADNGWGEVMLSVCDDISDPGNAALDGDQWLTFYTYDSQGRLIEEAQPSAIAG